MDFPTGKATMSKHPSVRMYCAPKAGNNDEEYEDAGCMVSDIERAGIVSRYAVADGATETSFAGMWARSLVMAYCRGLFSGSQSEDTSNTMSKLRQEWVEDISHLSLPWFAEDKARQGAFATLCGLTITKQPGTRVCDWQALAIGDSCLMQIREEKMILSFPLKMSSSFGNSPEMLCSLPSNADKIKFSEANGQGLTGDILLLMTDALACSVLSQIEIGLLPSQFIEQLHSTESFQKYIDEGREVTDQLGNKRIKNDDVTVLMIQV
jgi:hypothetical protein